MNEHEKRKFLVDSIGEIFSQILYDPTTSFWGDRTSIATMEAVRALLLHNLGISSKELPYQRRSDGMAFGNLQSHFSDFLLEFFRYISKDREELTLYQEELYRKPRLRDYGEGNTSE